MNLLFPWQSRPFHLTCILAIPFAFPLLLVAETLTYRLVVEAVEWDRANLPVTGEILLPAADRADAFTAELTDAEGSTRPVQLEMDPSGEERRLRISWVEPSLSRDASPEFTLKLRPGKSSPEAEEALFRFEQTEEYQDLFFGERAIYRYMTAYDPERHEDTHKPYHQIYGFHGEGFITKGPGGQFQHHKGIYLGWNQTRLTGGARYDFWHAPREHQLHGAFLPEREATGAVFARSASTTYWKTPQGESVVRDTREVTTWKLAGDELLLDYQITIEPLAGEIYLGGDAHHAGFQFRASQEVVERADETVIVSPPDAEGKPGDLWANAPWMAMSFDIAGNPYTVVHMDHPENPGPTTYSTRKYGRFGAFFTSRVAEEEPLILRYRIVIKNSRNGDAASPAALAALHADYVGPASVLIEKR